MPHWKHGDIEKASVFSSDDGYAVALVYWHNYADLPDRPMRTTTFLQLSSEDQAQMIAEILNSKRTLPEDRFDPAILTDEKSSEQKHLRTYLPQLCRAVKVISDAPTDGADIQIESLQLLSFIEAWIKPRMPAGSSHNDIVVEAIRTIAEAAIARVADKE